jgi:hypothetical protein
VYKLYAESQAYLDAIVGAQRVVATPLGAR